MSESNGFLEEAGYTLLGQPKDKDGGFAIIFKVKNHEADSVQAIKLLKEFVFDKNSKAYKSFLREFEIISKLGDGKHPNIVRVFKQRLISNHAIIEMEWVEGSDLRNYLVRNNRFLPVKELLHLLEQISSALAYCHGKRIIHNDIHSSNIMRRENGEFVLLDFGLAINGEEVERSSSQTKFGAPEYKSPEKWKNSKDLTEQSDIYSFGVALYEFLAGRVPFPADPSLDQTDNDYRLKTAHLETPPPNIFDLRKTYYEKAKGQNYKQDYPQWLEEVILKCLEKDPAKRFQNGMELYNHVLEHLGKDTETNADAYANANVELIGLRERIENLELLIKQLIERIEPAQEVASKLRTCKHCGTKATTTDAVYCRNCGKQL